MPHYHFHVHDGKELPDDEGIDLASVAEAREQAIVAAGEMIRFDGHSVWTGHPWVMNVVDAAGVSMFTLRFSADDHGYGPRLRLPW